MVSETAAISPEKPKNLSLKDRLSQANQPLNLETLGRDARNMIPSSSLEKGQSAVVVRGGDTNWLTTITREIYGKAPLTQEQMSFSVVLAASFEKHFGAISQYLPPSHESKDSGGLAIEIDWKTGLAASRPDGRAYEGICPTANLVIPEPRKPQDCITIAGMGFDAGIILPPDVFRTGILEFSLPEGTSFTGQMAIALGKSFRNSMEAVQNWIINVATVIDSQLPKGESIQNIPAGTSFRLDLMQGTFEREMETFTTLDQASALHWHGDLKLNLEELEKKEAIILTNSLEKRRALLNELIGSNPTLHQALEAAGFGQGTGEQARKHLLADPDLLAEVNARLPKGQEIRKGESSPEGNRILAQVILERSLRQVDAAIANQDRMTQEKPEIAQADIHGMDYGTH